MVLLKTVVVVVMLMVGWCRAAPVFAPAAGDDLVPDPEPAPLPHQQPSPSPNTLRNAPSSLNDDSSSSFKYVIHPRAFHPEDTTSSTSSTFFTNPFTTPFTTNPPPFTFFTTPRPPSSSTSSPSTSSMPPTTTTVPSSSVSPISPYFADFHGRPSPPPPALGDELLPPPPKCPMTEMPCDPASPYRTFSGTCNNLKHPDLGAAGHALINLAPQSYDLPSFVRFKSASGGLLPNPRLLSVMLNRLPEGPKHTLNSLFVQFGQFIDHDLAITATVGMDDDVQRPSCRPCSSWIHPFCLPIPIPPFDPYLVPFTPGTNEPRCLPIKRSISRRGLDTKGRMTLHQINQNTAFLDMSLIYGGNTCRAEELRSHTDGMLKSSAYDLPMRKPAKEFLRCNSDDGFCFFSGDVRANENLGLTVVHSLFHRLHNHLAKALKEVNSHWDDERLFQETRRINIAVFQNIVSREYVTALLGYHSAAKHKLIPQHEGYFLGYNSTHNPAIFNEFTTAAFRMGHSSVNSYFLIANEYYKVFALIPLVETFFNTSVLAQPGMFESLLRGLLLSPDRPADLSFVDHLNNKLFRTKGNPLSGHDLFAINIMRGRDHGLAPYVDHLSMCGIKEVSSFTDLESLMSREKVEMLSSLYRDVRDVDLIVGGLSENHVPDAMLGPTFLCILTTQFVSIKIADRFWFEGPKAGFTLDQLQTIRQITLASIICEVLDHPDPSVPAQAFHVLDQESNPLRRCQDLPSLDLRQWSEAPFHPPAQCRYLEGMYQVGRQVPVSPCLVCVCQSGGEVWCRCNTSGCTDDPQDFHCRRICGKSSPTPQSHLPPLYLPQYRQYMKTQYDMCNK